MSIKKICFLICIIFNLLFVNSTILANNIKNSAVVFMYHKFNTPKYPSTNITADQFEDHLEEFTKDKYNILSLEYIVDTIINDGELPNNTIGISIDDADKSFLDYAWPKFKENNIPVTLFVNTSTIRNISKNYLQIIVD